MTERKNVEGRYYFDGADCQLSAVEFGPPGAPPMVLVHGMRDHALSMQSIALAFPKYRVIAMDLRGHGDSDNTGSYTMTQLVADLHALFTFFELPESILIGHSLGGHIVSKYAALFPESVSHLVMIDGMGPPGSALPPTIDEQLETWKGHISAALQMHPGRRAMSDRAQALERLSSNNPKLDIRTASFIVDHGVEDHPDGGVRWKWDPRVNMVWSTFSQTESEDFYTRVQCPVLIVAGEYSLDYWAQMRPELRGRQAYQDSELERRRKIFPSAELVVIEGAGHMIHYDQPERLNQAVTNFLSDSAESC